MSELHGTFTFRTSKTMPENDPTKEVSADGYAKYLVSRDAIGFTVSKTGDNSEPIRFPVPSGTITDVVLPNGKTVPVRTTESLKVSTHYRMPRKLKKRLKRP